VAEEDIDQDITNFSPLIQENQLLKRLLGFAVSGGKEEPTISDWRIEAIQKKTPSVSQS